MGAKATEFRAYDDPVGSWWGAYENGEVWPVEVIASNLFGTLARPTHDAAPPGERWFGPRAVYDSNFNRPKWGGGKR
jgi:hypothetical protein